MPKPSPQHAPIMKELAAEIRAAVPGASIFAWHMGEWKGEYTPYIAEIYTVDGERIEGAPASKENKIVLKYFKALGWDEREDGLGFAFSVIDGQEAMDVEGTGTLDPQYRDHPGVPEYWL